MAELVLGPLVRCGGADELAVWVETSAPGTVEVLGRSAPTFSITGHHYAVVDLVDFPPGAGSSYDVELDGRRVWPDPEAGMPASRVRRWTPGERFVVAAGSCRQQAPITSPSHGGADVDGLGPDALAALAGQVLRGERPLPHLLLLTGDQVYADERHDSVTERLRRRRGRRPRPGRPEVSSFEEYTWLYQATWSHPLIRWILSCVPSLMIFDDHDVIDDWNISRRWVEDMDSVEWWPDRRDGALMSYWVYQHLGNLSPSRRESDPLVRSITDPSSDAGAELRAFARRVGTEPGRHRHSWSYVHHLGPVTVVVLDGRNGRVLEPGRRSMLSPTDWSLLDSALAETDGPLLIVCSVPWILPPGVHRLERWTSRVADGALGGLVARLGERLRRAIDLEHWAAFGDSFEELASRLRGWSERTSLRPIVLSGDVHFAYFARMPPAVGGALQVVSSPMRQANPTHEAFARRVAMTRVFGTLMRSVDSVTPGSDADTPFEVLSDVFYDNNLATLRFHGSEVEVAIETARVEDDGHLRLVPVATFGC